MKDIFTAKTLKAIILTVVAVVVANIVWAKFGSKLVGGGNAGAAIPDVE